jgi:predicted nucleic acid-binding protein
MDADSSNPSVVVSNVPWIDYPQPHLLDTSVMFSELYGISRRGRSRLLSSAESGSAILYMPTNVAAELPGKMPKIARMAKVPVEVVESAWSERYAPSVRIVDAPPAGGDLRRSELELIDPDDVAFADAVALMGPILAFSEDKHLTTRSLATDEWRDIPDLIAALKSVDVTLTLTPELTAIAISEAVKAARRHPWIAAALAALAFVIAGPFGPERTRLSRDRARAIGREILRGLIHLLETRRSSSIEIATRLVPGTAKGPVQIVAAALVRRQEPVELEVLAVRLAGEVDRDLLGAILVGYPAFFETATGWQLGRPAI